MKIQKIMKENMILWKKVCMNEKIGNHLLRKRRFPISLLKITNILLICRKKDKRYCRIVLKK